MIDELNDTDAVVQPAEGSVEHMFAALQVPAFRRLWGAGLVVFFAVASQAIARGWLARQLTGTNAGLGGVLLAFGVAMLLATPVGGVLADRLPKRLVLVISQLLLAVSALWVGLAITFEVVEYWMLMGASAVQAVAFALFGPARMAYTTDIVGGERLSNAIVLSQMGSEGMRVIGPTVAGVIIGATAMGLEITFIACGLLTLIATVITVFLPPAKPAKAGELISPLAQLRDGIAYVRNRPDLRILVACSLTVIMVGYPYMAFLPSVADGMFDRGSAGYGILSATSAVGAVLAGLAVARFSGRHDPWKFVTLSGFAFGVCLILIGVSPSFLVAAVVIAVTGGMSLMFQTTCNSMLLNLSAFEYHGRIQSIVMLGFSGFGIVALPLGALADRIGLRTTMGICGAVVVAVMATFVFRRRAYVEAELTRGLG